MITLYHAPRSRSSRMIWLLEELGAPYEIVITPIKRGSGEGEAAGERYRHVHPHLKVPAITHNGEAIFESSAITLYLTDAFPANGIAPKIGDAGRGAYVTWLAYYGDVMEPAFISKFMNWEVKPGTVGWAPVEEVMAYINGTLQKGPYLLGPRFSAADILMGSAFSLFMGGPLLPRTDLLANYVERLTSRPAYQRAAARDEG